MRRLIILLPPALLTVGLALACGGESGPGACTGEALTDAAIRDGAMAASGGAQVDYFLCFQQYARADFTLPGGDRAMGLFESDGARWSTVDLGSGIACSLGAEACEQLHLDYDPDGAPGGSPATGSSTPTCFTFVNDGMEANWTFTAGCDGYGCVAVSGDLCEQVCAEMWGEVKWWPKRQVDTYDHVIEKPTSHCTHLARPY